MALPKPLQRLRWRRNVGRAPAGGTPAVKLGPSAATRRDRAFPRSWAGLSFRDRILLERFLTSLKVAPAELHTHVPVGCVPTLDGDLDTAENRKLIASLYPRRVDACLRFGKEWWLVECKPDANHYVLGQVICYAYWWWRDLPGLSLVKVLVVTDECDVDVCPVLESMGIGVIELGPRL